MLNIREDTAQFACQFWQRLHAAIYDAIFAVTGGSTADPEVGYWFADRYAFFVLGRRLKRIRRKQVKA